MKSKYHIAITSEILGPHFSESALKTIIRANILQDRLIYQFNHDHFHFDGSSFDAGFKYIDHQLQLIEDKIRTGDYETARKALGRVTHTWQDFYSHSNYVPLWIKEHPNLTAEEINPADDSLIHNPGLRSGKNYGLMDMLALIPGFSRWVKPRMPEDSHAKMNMDSPEASPLFPYAYTSAKKRTKLIYSELMQALEATDIPHNLIFIFKGKVNKN
jgi:hypothetical protein